jgi:gamma-D-glutamyl-L-lysine dipeptidyl-peptidase
MFMRNLFLLLLLLAILSLDLSANKTTKLQVKLDAVCRELVPDKRVDICQVKITKGKDGKMELWGEVLTGKQKEKILAAVSGEKITDKITILPDTSLIKKCWGLITVSVANLKTEPSHSSEMASQAILGTPVRILKKEKNWLYIQTPDHYLAWVPVGSVQEMSEPEFKNWMNSERVIFTENYGLVYNDINQTEIINDLVAGSILQKTGESGNWVLVALPDGRSGSVEKNSLLDFNQWKLMAEVTPGNLIRTAKKFLGIPYLWGGTSSKMIDCSGFMKNVWFLNGIILERDASQQFRHGVEIKTGDKLDNLQPGDVLFFGSKEPKKITHTGMFIGNGEVIHSSASNSRVWINSLDPERANFSRILSSSFVGVKRIINQQPQFGYMPVKDHPWY